MEHIYLTGDTHGTIDIHKLGTTSFDPSLLDDTDFVIILGDFGFLWTPYPSKDEIWWLKWLDEKPWTTLVIDGNHDNHERYPLLPDVDMFGSTVGRISKSVFHLRRGHIYDIFQHKFYVMGGAQSIDKVNRIEGKSWWADEIPTCAQFELGLQNLEKNNWTVDYILSHTCSQKVINEYLESLQHGLSKIDPKNNDPVARYFDEIHNLTTFKKHFFGHMHPEDIWVSKDQKSICLYNDIVYLDVFNDIFEKV
jgi:hypothetical protein